MRDESWLPPDPTDERAARQGRALEEEFWGPEVPRVTRAERREALAIASAIRSREGGAMSFVEVEIDDNILGYAEANARGIHIVDKTIWIALS